MIAFLEVLAAELRMQADRLRKRRERRHGLAPLRCSWCDQTAEACRAMADRGFVKCCPDCDHRSAV